MTAHRHSIRIGLGLLAAVLLTAGVPAQQGPSQAELNDAANDADNWLHTNHDYGGQRFVDLDQITPDNVGTLQRQCVYEPGYQGPFETNPLVRNGTMYLTAGIATMAIDAVTCDVVWRHDWEPRSRGGFPMQRGVALKDGIVVRGTSDSHLLALDAATGELLWEVLAANPERGEAFTMPPMIFEDLVIIGPCCSETGVRGWVGGFRLEDGTQAWRFNTVPEPGEPGAETWSDPGNHFVGGGAVWTPFALDPETARVYIPVANPAPDFWSEVREGSNLYTGSMVVLDARSGELQWYYQAVPHDLHDWDQTQASPLFSTTVNGQERKVVTTVGKDGILHVLDRETEEHLYEVPVTRRENTSAPITIEGTRACPGVTGGVEWNGPAYNPRLNALFVPAVDWCAVFKRAEELEYIQGRLYLGGQFILDDMTDARGVLTALDASTGVTRWRYDSETPMVAALTTTATGLVFTGELTGHFLALDGDDGEVLFRDDLGVSIHGGVVSYAVDGRQYVAVVAGNTSGLWPTVRDQGRVVVYTLPR